MMKAIAIVQNGGLFIPNVVLNAPENQLFCVEFDVLNEPKSYAKGDFNFDFDMIKKAVESPTTEVPQSALQDFESFDKWVSETF